MADFDDYKDLKKTFEYDHKKATRLAEAVTETLALKKRIEYLTKIVNDNDTLTQFLWTTAEGETKALHDIENSHLENIIRHITRGGGGVSEQIIAEAESRGMDVETLTTLTPMLPADIFDMLPADIFEENESIDWDAPIEEWEN